MTKTISKSVANDIESLGISIEAIQNIYPKIVEAKVPLSNAKVSAFNFQHWKKNGLVDIPVAEEDRSWVRLNVFQYVWFKMIKEMRSFGFPLTLIKECKRYLFFHLMEEIAKDPKGYLSFLKDKQNLNKDQLAAQARLIEEYKAAGDVPDEYKILGTSLGTVVARILVKKVTCIFQIRSDEGKNDFELLYPENNEHHKKIISSLQEATCFHIPINKILGEFFEEPKNEKLLEDLMLISPNEKKVLDAIRTRDFKEIIIQLAKDKQKLVIEVVKDGDLMEEKARQIKKILGLNEYSEITLKYRNDKHIYFKNKIRINIDPKDSAHK